MRYWLVVVSKDHALKGINGGFMQACHGKAAPLRRMKPSDYLICYCHKTTFNENIKCQKLVGIGKVTSGTVYQFQISETFHPYRIDINFIQPTPETDIHPLISQLSFIKDKTHWGYQFRFGHLEISETDFDLIVYHMSPEILVQINAERNNSRLL